MNVADFSLEACYDEVAFQVEVMGKDIFELLGRYIVRAKQDIFFNKMMIDACEEYIKKNNIKWDD